MLSRFYNYCKKTSDLRHAMKKNRIIYNKKNTLIDLKNCTFFQFEEMLLIIQTCKLPDYRMRKNTIMKRIDNKIRKQ